MPGQVPTHNANMAKLCIMCCNQGQLVKPAGKGTNGKRVTSEVAATVKKHFMSDFDPDSFDMPNGLCPKHRKLLNQVDNDEKSPEDLPKPLPLVDKAYSDTEL